MMFHDFSWFLWLISRSKLTKVWICKITPLFFLLDYTWSKYKKKEHGCSNKKKDLWRNEYFFVNCFVVLVANWGVFFSPSYIIHIHVSCIMVKLHRRQCYNKTCVHVVFFSCLTIFSYHIFYCITKNLHDAVSCIR